MGDTDPNTGWARAGHVFLTIIRFATWPALIASALFLGLWMVPAAREWMIEHKWATDDAAIAVIGIMIPFTLGSIASLNRQVSRLSGVVNELLASRDQDTIRGGTGAIYPLIDAELRARKKSRTPIVIDVLGYTLFSVYPALTTWLEDDVLANMSINLYALDPAFARSSPLIRDDWATRSTAEQENIRRLLDENAEKLTKRNVTVQIHTYSHIPAIHGFSIGNGSLYISFAIWSRGQVADPQNAVFERVRGSDDSFHAKALRTLFDNWVKAASTDPGANDAGP